jgi:hypothetical protein
LTTLLVLVFLAVVLLAGLLGNRRRRRRPHGKGRNLTPGVDALHEVSARDRLLALAESIREALCLQFGSAWRAKTTEELATDPRLALQLGESDFQAMIQFLDQIDHVKFAPERSDNHEVTLQKALETWDSRVVTLRTRIQAKPRGRSKASRGGSQPRRNRDPQASGS